MKKVLIVEDNKGWVELWKEQLSGEVELLFASSVEEAINTIFYEEDIAVLAVDSTLTVLNDGVEVILFAIDQKFTGKIISTSGIRVGEALLMAAGATEKIDKVYFVKVIKKYCANEFVKI